MAHSGRIFHNYTFIETDEQGNIWVVLNHFEGESVLMEMESSSRGQVMDDGAWLAKYDDDLLSDEDYL